MGSEVAGVVSKGEGQEDYGKAKDSRPRVDSFEDEARSSSL